MYDNDEEYFNRYNHVKLYDGIHVLKSFINEDDCNKIMDIINIVPEKEWHGIHTNPMYLLANNQIKYGLPKIFTSIGNKYSNIFDNKYLIHGPNSLAKMSKDSVCEIHADNCEQIDYAWPWTAVLYLNNFEGGEISYPSKNITYKPEAGDLLFHRPDSNYEHEVLKVKSESRYVLSAYIRKPGFIDQ